MQTLEAAFADSAKNAADCALLNLSRSSTLRGSVSLAGAEWLCEISVPHTAKRLVLLLDEYPEPRGRVLASGGTARERWAHNTSSPTTVVLLNSREIMTRRYLLH